MEAWASAVTRYSRRSAPAIPPAVFMRTASCTAPPLVLGNMMRMGDVWKTSTMRVPVSEPLTTIRPDPFARWRSLSDQLPADNSTDAGPSLELSPWQYILPGAPPIFSGRSRRYIEPCQALGAVV